MISVKGKGETGPCDQCVVFNGGMNAGFEWNIMRTWRACRKEGSLMTQKNDISKTSLLLFFFFLLLMVAGINAGEVSSVWEKAVNICLSCIGVG